MAEINLKFEELENLKYADLQKIAKQHGVKANIKADKIILALRELSGGCGDASQDEMKENQTGSTSANDEQESDPVVPESKEKPAEKPKRVIKKAARGRKGRNPGKNTSAKDEQSSSSPAVNAKKPSTPQLFSPKVVKKPNPNVTPGRNISPKVVGGNIHFGSAAKPVVRRTPGTLMPKPRTSTPMGMIRKKVVVSNLRRSFSKSSTFSPSASVIKTPDVSQGRRNSTVDKTPKLNSSKKTPNSLAKKARNSTFEASPNSSLKKTPNISARKTPNSNIKKTPNVIVKKTPNSAAKKTPNLPAKKTPNSVAKRTPNSSIKKRPGPGIKKTPTSASRKKPQQQSFMAGNKSGDLKKVIVEPEISEDEDEEVSINPQSKELADLKKTPSQKTTMSNIPRYKALGINKSTGETKKKTQCKDWSKIHQKQWDKMESIDEYLAKKRKRTETMTQSVKKMKLAAEQMRANLQSLKNKKTPVSQNKAAKPVDKDKSAKTKASLFQTPSSNPVPFKPTVTSTSKMNLNFGSSLNKSDAKPLFTIGMNDRKSAVKSNLSMTTKTTNASRKSGAFNDTTNKTESPFRFRGNSSVNTSHTNSFSSAKKFDLKQSLSKPITWNTHKGKLKPFEFNAAPINITHESDVKGVKVKSRQVRRDENIKRQANKRKNDVMSRRGIQH